MIFHWLTELAARTVLMSPLGVPFRAAQRFLACFPATLRLASFFLRITIPSRNRSFERIHKRKYSDYLNGGSQCPGGACGRFCV